MTLMLLQVLKTWRFKLAENALEGFLKNRESDRIKESLIKRFQQLYRKQENKSKLRAGGECMRESVCTDLF